MKVMVTGAAGFIGMHTCIALINKGYEVCGIDNYNEYYNPSLKWDRVCQINSAHIAGRQRSAIHNIDLLDRDKMVDFMYTENPDAVIHLAAYAGVRT